MNRKVFIFLTLLVVLYLAVNFATPPNPTILLRYKMDAGQYQLMRASLAVPIILVWYAAFYGFSKLMGYARSIKQSPDGEGFMWIAYGLAVLGIGLPVNSLIATALSRAVSGGMLTQPVSTIISTHLSVGYQLASFFLIALGAWKLLKTLKKAEFPKQSLVIGSVLLATISVFYIVAAFNNPSREVAVPPAQTATYYMNDILIFSTIVLPYIFAWVCGFFSFIAIKTYYRHVGGVLYKKALKKLNTGLLIIISLSVFLQFATAAITSIYAWLLGPLVIATQLFVFVIGIGFIYVALGAKGLAKLEEVK